MALGSLLALGAMLWFATSLARSDNVETRLGDDRFVDMQIGRISDAIASGGPILYSDVAGGDRDIWVQHIGDDPEDGWKVFEVREPGTSRECFAQWEPEDRIFRDTCDGTEYPADGSGLPAVASSVVDGRVVIDINAADRPEPEPTTTTQPESTIIISGNN